MKKSKKIFTGLVIAGLILSIIYFKLMKKSKLKTENKSIKTVDDLEISQSGLNLIKQHEGLASTNPISSVLAANYYSGYIYSYIDPVGVPTIGYGHTKNVNIGDKITVLQADDFLKQDVKEAENAVKSLVKVPINQNMYDALVSFTFNLGSGNLKKSTLLKKLNQNKHNEAADEFLKWKYAGGMVLQGLEKRRKEERLKFLS